MSLYHELVELGTRYAKLHHPEERPSREYCLRCALIIAANRLEGLLSDDETIRASALAMYRALAAKETA